LKTRAISVFAAISVAYAVAVLLWWGVAAKSKPADFWSRPEILACCSHGDAVYSDQWRFANSGKVAIVVVSRVTSHSAWAKDQIGREYLVDASKFRMIPNNQGSAILFLKKYAKLPDGRYEVYCFVPGLMI